MEGVLHGKREADQALRGRHGAGRSGETRPRRKRDQVRVPRDAHGLRVSGHDGDDPPSEGQRLQGLVHGP